VGVTIEQRARSLAVAGLMANPCLRQLKGKDKEQFLELLAAYLIGCVEGFSDEYASINFE
jgi:hypothetical protein